MDDTKEPTDKAELERQIMSYDVAKSEREWWARDEIERLRSGMEAIERIIACFVPTGDDVVIVPFPTELKGEGK